MRRHTAHALQTDVCTCRIQHTYSAVRCKVGWKHVIGTITRLRISNTFSRVLQCAQTLNTAPGRCARAPCARTGNRSTVDGRPLTRRTGHGHTPRGREYSQVSSPPPTPTHVQIDSQSLLPPPLQQRHRASRLRVRVGRRGMAGTAHREAAPLLLAVSGAAPPLERLVCAPRVGVGRRLAAA